MSTTLEPAFLLATLHITGFKGAEMRRAQGALLTLAYESNLPITAADLPGEITEGNTHLAGAAAGALIAQGLLTGVGRCKSPRPEAKGRKLNLLAIPSDKRSTVKTWLERNGFPAPRPAQIALLTA